MWDGYSESTREIIARRILARYHNNLDNLEKEGRPLYRSKEMRAMDLKQDKATWFRTQGATATIQVPCTKNSILAKKVRELIRRVRGPRGTSVKVVERPGP